MNISDHLGSRRALQVGVLTSGLLIVLGFLAIDTLGRPQDTRTVYVLTRSVAAGAQLDAAGVREERIPASRTQYSYLGSFPSGRFAAHALSPGDILRPDDIETTPFVAVPVKLGGYQPTAGDTIDIYVVEGGKVSLVGRGITVVNGSTIQVPASDEPLWIALYGSSATLLGARSNGTGVPDAAAVSGTDAARRLGVLAHQGTPPTASPTP